MAEQRSKPYPSINLEESVKKIEDVVRKLGNAKKYDKNTFAQGLSYKNAKNGAFLRTSAALIQYNLIQREGDSYSLSQLSQAILYPTNADARLKAIKSAAMCPQVFESLYTSYKGQELPALLPNILVAEYGILVGAKDKVVAIFKATMEYAGLLDDNKLIDPDGEIDTTAPQNDRMSTKEIPTLHTAPSPVTPPVLNDLVATTSLIKDFGEGRVASLTIPTDLNDDERKKLANLIENM